MTFMEIAGSRPVYVICGVAVLLVTLILLAFLVFAWKRGLELGLSKETMTSTVKTTLSVSIGPLFSVLVPLFAMIKVLGAPWSWLRLSVIGSAAMELGVANLGLSSAGYADVGTPDLPGEAFGLVVLVVGFGITAGIVLNIFLNKKVSTGFTSIRSKNPARAALLISALFAAFLANLSANYLVTSAVHLAVFLTALALTVLMNVLIQKTKNKKLGEYSFAIGLIISMAMAIVWAKVLG